MSNAAYRIRKLFWFFIRPKTFGASVILRCGSDVLLADYSYGHGWNFPTASIIHTEEESPTECAQRFLRQEYSIAISAPKYLGMRYCRFEYRRDTVFCFLADISSKEFALANPFIREARWFPIRNLPNKVSPFAQEIIDTYFRRFAPE